MRSKRVLFLHIVEGERRSVAGYAWECGRDLATGKHYLFDSGRYGYPDRVPDDADLAQRNVGTDYCGRGSADST